MGSLETPQKSKESLKPPRKLPQVLNVRRIFDVMVSSAELSPLKRSQDTTHPAELIEIKNEAQLETNPPSVPSSELSLPVSEENSRQETSSSSDVHTAAVSVPRTSPKKETLAPIDPLEPHHQTTPIIVPETSATVPHFQPISIKNE